ncbi:hypothetical protein THERMOT_500 [Bathymodiolus thermophilus thioautotrophic gill symbiont]|uniref:Uncharacterized protein n=1 Tax=Bathymodiolus thermophilus thioautotrophic gill symbiont TaxID=2360 RepID=A0A1J5TTS2_9GAMM|nr:hypothetical protein [Bathymodiolus thermophilus thioautotrophic gill symbiont]OIR24235.1 hypothetical protein BGC33_02990 [Bathymodiolus thermophilus thioautotrophic gill symbiont]CAB5496345.1 hypothetical protein THERMOT_500 [Bathymodiolus thermophilus thioautotrophic gill symbiont]
MSSTEIHNDKDIALFHAISDTEKHKSDNDKEVRLAEIAMSERTAKIEIESKAHNLEQEKDFRLTNILDVNFDNILAVWFYYYHDNTGA